MDVNSSIRKTKRKKMKGAQATDSSGKGISNLPDVLLEHIVSFLPTAAAVRTSILSKRWLHLWKFSHNLEFYEMGSTKRKLFMDFVDRVFALRGPSNIEKFTLSCKVRDDSSRISTWISAAVNHNIKELFIHLRELEAPFALPHFLFTCETLRELEISIPGVLKLPSSISLSSLKILNLIEITFPDDLSTQQLLNLPNLVDLVINECNWDNLQAVSICAPKLQSLSINEPTESTSALGGCHVRIFGADLTDFSLIGDLSNEYCLSDCSVVATSIYIVAGRERRRQIAYRAYKLLEELSNSSVEFLNISTDVLDVLDEASELFASPFKFMNLTTLMFDSDTLNLHSDAFWRIIYNSPRLTALLLKEVILPKVPSNCLEDGTLDPAPPCFLSSLKRIEVHCFCGEVEELDAVGFFLKNAPALDAISINCSEVDGADQTNKIRQQLLLELLPRWSKIGKIKFC